MSNEVKTPEEMVEIIMDDDGGYIRETVMMFFTGKVAEENFTETLNDVFKKLRTGEI